MRYNDCLWDYLRDYLGYDDIALEKIQQKLGIRGLEQLITNWKEFRRYV